MSGDDDGGTFLLAAGGSRIHHHGTSNSNSRIHHQQQQQLTMLQRHGRSSSNAVANAAFRLTSARPNLLTSSFISQTTFSSSSSSSSSTPVAMHSSSSLLLPSAALPLDAGDQQLVDGPLGLAPGLGIGLLLLILILLCVLGNLLVILAILFERDLRSRPQYYLIFSLAVADLMVGLIVTPLGAWTTLRQNWELGVTLCDFWISVDVLVCTSSILHLVAIALDRYWSITDIYYTQNRTPRRIFTILLVIWVLSLLISLAPQFEFLHLKDKGFVSRVKDQKVCLISQDIAYQVFSTSTAFYIPLCAIIIVYYKIMRAAKKRFRRERDRRTMNRGTVLDESTAKLTGGTTARGGGKCAAKLMLRSQNPSNAQNSTGAVRTPLSNKSRLASHACNLLLDPATQQHQNGHHFKSKMKPSESVGQTSNAPLSPEEDDSIEERTQFQLTSTLEGEQTTCCLGGGGNIVAETEFTENTNSSKRKKMDNSYGGARRVSKQLLQAAFPRRGRKKKGGPRSRESVETRRERKAWRTLAIITGTFIACWTPFFVLSLYRPICLASTGESHCRSIPPLMEQIFNWLGYLNSALNPVIYTIFSMDFRLAFERILKRIFFLPSS